MMEEINKDLRNNPRELIDHMTTAVHTFVNGAEQSDDLTLLAVQLTKTIQS